MGMGGHFGADVALTAKGEYQFTVGTKLADGGKVNLGVRDGELTVETEAAEKLPAVVE